MSHQHPTIGDYEFWDEYSLWLEKQGLHEEEAPIVADEELWIGHTDEWSGEDVPEPPPNFVEEHWEADTGDIVGFWRIPDG